MSDFSSLVDLEALESLTPEKLLEKRSEIMQKYGGLDASPRFVTDDTDLATLVAIMRTLRKRGSVNPRKPASRTKTVSDDDLVA